jgi:hypothetical protein
VHLLEHTKIVKMAQFKHAAGKMKNWFFFFASQSGEGEVVFYNTFLDIFLNRSMTLSITIKFFKFCTGIARKIPEEFNGATNISARCLVNLWSYTEQSDPLP